MQQFFSLPGHTYRSFLQLSMESHGSHGGFGSLVCVPNAHRTAVSR